MNKLLIRSKLPSLIRSNLKIFISIALIASMGMITLIALISSYQTLTASLDEFRDQYGYPAITVNTTMQTDTSGLLESIQLIDGVDTVDKRLTIDAQITRKDGRGLTARIMGYSDTTVFNLLNIIESGGTGEGIPLFVDQYFASLNDMHLGDPITIAINGKQHQAHVSQIVSAFETTSVTRNAYTYFDTMDFGYIYLADTDLQALISAPAALYNQVFISVKQGSDAQSILDAIQTRNASTIVSGYTYSASPPKSVLDSSTTPLRTLSVTIPPLLYLITLLITYLFIYQVIQDQRHEIGVLRALGFSSKQIRWLYFSFSLAISAISAILGIPAGCFLTRFVSATYQTCYGIPSLHYVYDIRVILLALAATTFIGLLGTHISAKSIFKISPAEAMREKSAQQAVTPVARKLVASLNSVAKVSISSSLRNKKRVLISLVSVILTSFLLLVSLSYSFSIRDIINHTFSDRYQYDCQIFFTDTTTTSQIQERLAGYTEIHEMEPVGMRSVMVKAGDQVQEALICGIPGKGSMIQVSDANRDILPIPDRGIILEAHLAEALGVMQGGTVLINGTAVEVTAISKENINYTQYCSLQEFVSIFGEGSINSAIVKMKEPTAEISFYHTISTMENFSYLSFNAIQEQSVNSTFSFSAAGVYTIILSALIVGFLIIYNMSVINIQERIRDYAVMRVLGISTRAIALGTYAEILFQFIVSIIIGLGFGNIVSNAMLSQMNSANITYFNANSIIVYIVIGFAVFLFMSFGHFLAVLKIHKLDLIESLKTRE